LFAEELLKRLKEVEVLVGREKQVSKGYSDRVIDIDILFYDSLVLLQNLYVSPTLFCI
jgi:2-amino-4-hydroxy-6-hydroxymethyldihydropteridine diphosphokinase